MSIAETSQTPTAQEYAQLIFDTLGRFRFSDESGRARDMLFRAAGITNPELGHQALRSLVMAQRISVIALGGNRIVSIERTDRDAEKAPVWHQKLLAVQDRAPYIPPPSPPVRPVMISPVRKAGPATGKQSQAAGTETKGVIRLFNGKSLVEVRSNALARALAEYPGWRWESPTPSGIHDLFPPEVRLEREASAATTVSLLVTRMRDRGEIRVEKRRNRWAWIELTDHGAEAFEIQRSVRTTPDDRDLASEDEARETVRVSCDGAQYELEMTLRKAQELRASLAPYIAAARRSN